MRNPYSPGAGTRPPALVGRDREIEAMDVALQRLLLGRDGRSQMLTGLRGVGKTVLLNEYELLAEARGYFHEHIEVSDDGGLAHRLVAAFRKILLAMDAKRRIGRQVAHALGVLKAFSVRLPDGPEIHIDVEPVTGPADSGELAADLAGLFVELGEVARAHDTGVFITIDELHYVDEDTLAALVVGLHRAAQLRLPVTVAGAGLQRAQPRQPVDLVAEVVDLRIRVAYGLPGTGRAVPLELLPPSQLGGLRGLSHPATCHSSCSSG